MRPIVSTRRSLALCLAASLMLAACGALWSGSSAADDPIVFGATIPITGPKAEEGRYTRDGYQFYIDTLNQRGGIVVGGRAYKVRLHYYDDASDPARVGPLYERLIAQDRVTFLLGPYSSQLTVAAIPIAEKNRVPMVAAHGSAESLYSEDNGYTFSIVSPARNYLRGIIAGHLQDAILIVKQAKELGVTPKAIGFTSGPSTPEFRANLQKDADYIFGATQWTSALHYSGIGLWATPRDYAAAFQAAHRDYAQVPYQTAESTAALIAFQHAIEQAGSLDSEAVRAAFANLDVMTFYGRIKFDARGVNMYKPMAVEQLQPDGKIYTVFPSDVAERAALYPMPPWNRR